jgi:hypothetical protein
VSVLKFKMAAVTEVNGRFEVDFLPFTGCFVGTQTAVELSAMQDQVNQALKNTPSASFGDGRLQVFPATFSVHMAQWNAGQLVKQRIVYSTRPAGTSAWKLYGARFEVVNGKLVVRVSSAFNYFGDVTQIPGDGFQLFDFPVLGHEYGFIVAATVFMASERNKIQQQLTAGSQANAALQQHVQQLTAQLAALQVGSSAGVVAIGPTSSDYLQGCDTSLPFDVWNPASYNTTFYRDPQLAVLSTMTAIRLGGRQDVIRMELIETAEVAMRAWALEKQPFLSPWTEVLRAVLARVRDYDWRCQGVDPQTIRFNLNKEAGFPGVDPLQAAFLQAKQKQMLKAGRGAPRGGGGGGYQAGSSRGRGGQGNGRGAGSQ